MPTETDVRAGLATLIKNASALFVAMAALFAATWYFVEPRVAEWMQTQQAPLVVRVADIEADLTIIKNRTTRLVLPFIEFSGSGKISRNAVIEPGGKVSITYVLRRNLPCDTDVMVQFIRQKTGRIDTSMSFTFKATKARVSEDFGVFTADIQIPDDMPPGEWAYAPRLHPVGCNGVPDVQAPPSDFFTVRAL